MKAKIPRRKGAKVRFDGADMRVVALPDFDHLTLQDAKGEFFHVSVADLEAQGDGAPQRATAIDEKRAEKMEAYTAALGSLLDRSGLSTEEVRTAGAKLGMSLSSTYRALARYRLSGATADLPPPTKPGGRGKSRIEPAAQAIIETCIKEIVLTRRNFSRRKFLREAKSRLRKAGFEVGETTLRQRLASIPDYMLQKARKGAAETKRTHEAIKGEYPEVLKPLESLQIDHWFADIEIVGDDRLASIGRVWITVAIDIYSRMIWGIHIGLDPPSTATVGMAMISGMTRKDATLKRYGLTMEMPIAGKPEEIRADNAGEFAGDSMQLSCSHFNIRLTWRPIDNPQYGGHIEALNGLLATRFKDLPGATGSTFDERKRLQPTKTAAFTLEDLNKHVWLLIDEYHNEVHMGIRARPIDKFKSYFFGPEGLKRNLPDVYPDTIDLRREWFPLELRSIQAYGIRIEFLSYSNESIQQLIRNRKGLPKVKIRRNPLDVREIHLEHPVRKEWVVLPVRQIGFPLAAIWELQAAIREALRLKRARTPENLARIILEQQSHIEEAQRKTKTAQRAATRRSANERTRQQARAGDGKPAVITSAGDASDPSIDLAILPPPTVHPEAKERKPSPRQPAQPGRPAGSEHASDIAAILANITDDDVDRLFDD